MKNWKLTNLNLPIAAWLCAAGVACAWTTDDGLGQAGKADTSVDTASSDGQSLEDTSLALSHTQLIELIDREIAIGYERMLVDPAGVCSDETFVRRIYLDLAGRIPTTLERSEFLKNSSSSKRQELIDRLLSREDFVQHFADMFDTMLMGRVDRNRYKERLKHWRPYLENVFRNNRPWDQVASEILLARPQSPDQVGADWFLYERNDNAQAIAEAVAPAFFGIKIDCAQCHDHMIASEIEQRHYWGLVAFFNRSKNQKTNAGPRVVESAVGGFSDFANLKGSSSPNLLTFYGAKTVDEARPEKDKKQEDADELYVASPMPGEPRIPKFSRRELFVSEIFKDHPLVSKAIVNRIWAVLMGRGIVHPLDQMNSAHEPSHPQLLESLAEDFRNSGCDIRRLVKAIVGSRAYQLSSIRPPACENPASFAWYLERQLTAEQFARSLAVGLLGHPDKAPNLLAELREKLPAVMPENNITGVSDALFLSNNKALNTYIEDSAKNAGLVEQLMNEKDPQVAIEKLFIGLYGRFPSAEESVELLRFQRLNQIGSEDAKTASKAWIQLAWALITSSEFLFNH